MKTENFSLFLNSTIEKSFCNGPTIRATFQIIVCKNAKNKYEVDCIDAMDMEIDMLGKTITSNTEVSNIIDHYESMGVNLYNEAEKDLEEIIKMSGNVETFVFEQTGIILPTNQSTTKQNDVVELTRHELEYVLIMNDLKQRFGSLGYYNDKRKTFRRIKIYHGPTPSIQKYMYEKYPHIETYFITDPWSGGLCFKLPLQ
jgi:hypothetical protein